MFVKRELPRIGSTKKPMVAVKARPSTNSCSGYVTFWKSQKDFTNPRDFLHAFKVDLFSNEVYVFTPRGEVIAIQKGATPVDFAYAVHTDIGHHCTTAKVNGKIVPLRYKLRNGDQVAITTSKQKTPSRDWLPGTRFQTFSISANVSAVRCWAPSYWKT